MMVHSLISFTQLTRGGVIPEFVVRRFPLLAGGQELQVGDVLPADALVNRTRLRQMYEQRRISPLKAPANSRQAAAIKVQTGSAVAVKEVAVLPTGLPTVVVNQTNQTNQTRPQPSHQFSNQRRSK